MRGAEGECDPTVKGKIVPGVRGKVEVVHLVAVVNWCTDPVVYLFPMLGIFASQVVIAIQVGYGAAATAS